MNFRFLLVFVTLTLFNTLHVFGQSKAFLAKLDTTYQPSTHYFTDYTYEEFFASGLADQEFNPADYDTNLLNASVFHTVNRQRVARKKTPFKYSPELAIVAYNYINLNTSRKFVYNRDNWKRIVKTLPKVCRIFGFKGALLNANIAAPYALNFKSNKKFYYDKFDRNTDLHLFYGERPARNDSLSERNPVPMFTYATFAENFIKKWQGGIGNRNNRSKAYEYLACFLTVDPKTLNRNKIPRMKAFMVFGGYKVNWNK